jgi:hypothetical protein
VDRKAFRLDRSLTWRELALAWAALAALAVVGYISLVLHGGFHLDDWSNGAGTFYPPGGRSISHSLEWFKELTFFRPVLVLYVPLTYVVFGMHEHVFLAWAVVLAWAGIGLFYGVLRRLGVPWIHALVIAGLVLIFPWFDSTRMMPSAAVITLSIFFLMAGAWISLIALDRRDLRFHFLAAAFYLLSILSYEITLPLIACLGLLYLLRAGWREARWRWAIDIVVVIAGGIWNLTHTARETSGISGDVDHLREIIDGGKVILGQTLLPTKTPQTTLVLIALGVVLGVGVVVWWRERGSGDGGDAAAGRGSWFREGIGRGGRGSFSWGLREWLLLAAGGIFVFVLGWAIFIPANPYYTPVIWGVTNRVNGMAGFGTVMTVYAALGVFGCLVGRLLRGVALAAVAITLALAAALGLGYGIVLHNHTGMWNAAWVKEEEGLAKITARYPTLPPGTTIYATNWPGYETLGVPIYSATWDLDGMLKDHYETAEVSGYPLLEGWGMYCKADTVELEAEGTTISFAEYGKARIVNLGEEKAFIPKDRKSCEQALQQVAAGPLYLSYEY